MYSCDVVVVGGGIAGVCTSLVLAEEGYRVILLEKRHDVLKGTSNVTPGRMSLGAHYFSDYRTAVFNLRKTLEFVKTFKNFFPECFIRGNINDNWHYGLYAIVKDSFVSPIEAINVLDILKESYREITQEPNYKFLNELYGEADDFYELLDVKKYRTIDANKVNLLVQTREMLLNWAKFKFKLKEKLCGYPSIEVINNAEVISIYDGKLGFNHEVLYRGKNDRLGKILSDFVVLCTWENIEEININSGLKTSLVTNRLKLLAEIQLPEKLVYHPSTFFCTGPFAMFSNMGDGTAKVTYAPVTNWKFSYESPIPDDFKKLIYKEGLLGDRQEDIGQSIIDGVSLFIPDLKAAKLLEVKAGIVKQICQSSDEFFDINAINSSHHTRNYSGVEVKNEGTIINNSSIKLFYGASNAIEVLKIISKYREPRTITLSLANCKH